MWRAAMIVIGSGLVSVSAHVPVKEVWPGVHMPMMAFGTCNDSFAECSVQDAVSQFLQLGGHHLDTAVMYKTHRQVGEGMRASGVARSEIFLTTKVNGPVGKEVAKDQILNDALPNLGVDYLDLVLVHFPCPTDKSIDCGSAEAKALRLGTWEGLMDLHKAGKIRAVGVSNYHTEHVQEIVMAGLGRPAVNQVEWHLAYHNETLREGMELAGVTLEAWGPLTRATAPHPGVALGDDRLKAMAAKYSATPPQVVLNWMVTGDVAPVTASCVASHVKGDLDAFDFELSAEDMLALNAMAPEEHQRMIMM